MKADWKLNNSVKVRNTHPSVAFHDVIKLLMVRLIRRKNPDNNILGIYTEHNFDDPNSSYPDIMVKAHYTRNSIKQPKDTIYEIQETYSEEWLKKLETQYEGVDVVPIKLKLIAKKMKDKHNIDIKDVIDKLSKILEDDYVGEMY